MGKWIDKLLANSPAPPFGGTAKTDTKVVLTVLAVGAQGGALEINHVEQDLDSRRLDIHARLLRWGWRPAEAQETAARIAARQPDDDRKACAECCAYRPVAHRCINHRAAGVQAADVGHDLAGLLQRCPGFAPANINDRPAVGSASDEASLHGAPR